jgi:hypothetical protein
MESTIVAVSGIAQQFVFALPRSVCMAILETGEQA